MKNPQILITSHIPSFGVDLLRKEGFGVTFWDKDIPLQADELAQLVPGHDAMLSSSADRLDADFLASAKHLKIISQFAVGYDNIDISAATKLGIAFGNAPGVMSEATADIAFGLMIATSRKMFYLYRKVLDGKWSHFVPRADLGIGLRSKVLGVYGLGRIGMEMSRLAKSAYGMEIIYCNRSNNQMADDELNAQRVSFTDMLRLSDVISVHCALTDETRGVFNAEAFAEMKPSAIFINTSRGGVHNETDLIKALQDETIWGAGLDVTNPEPMQQDNPLLQMENVCILPHVGSATIHTRNEMSRLAAENIIAYFRGEEIPHLVNPNYTSRISG